ncbi:A24 family peptidase [Gorillibacterium sp. CAU 1737]|uniref:A24 family peptidase n=1 Tax=Gorillibacterium sp. CAU 1737 TaxID=3140362 RepID=UPI0032614A2E
MIWILLFLLITAAAVTDLRDSKIPNAVCLAGMGSGMGMNLLLSGWTGAWHSLTGLVIGFASLFLLHVIGALGAGDVKLFAAIGSISGGGFAIQCALYSILFAGVIGILILINRKLFKERLTRVGFILISVLGMKQVSALTEGKKKDMLRFPFMYAVVPAVILLAMDSWLNRGWGFL